MRSLGNVAKTGPAKTGPAGPLATAMGMKRMQKLTLKLTLLRDQKSAVVSWRDMFFICAIKSNAILLIRDATVLLIYTAAPAMNRSVKT